MSNKRQGEIGTNTRSVAASPSAFGVISGPALATCGPSSAVFMASKLDALAALCNALIGALAKTGPISLAQAPMSSR
ncbi:hypothetical protein ASD69_18505 [Lysobacter sp. Root604]|nr:hypothetical protein ASD69_18505 [Lysobacter sp. Root604]